MVRRLEMPKLEVARLAASDGLAVGFIAWNYIAQQWISPLRPWPRRRSELVPTLHIRFLMLSGEFAGNYHDFFPRLDGKPEMYSGTFTYKGVRFRCEELHGADAEAVIQEHFDEWY